MARTNDKSFSPGEKEEAEKEVKKYLNSPDGERYSFCTVCHRHYVWDGMICIDCLEMGKSK